MLFYDKRADVAEFISRNRLRAQIFKILVVSPLMGAAIGILASIVALVACTAQTPFEFVIAVAAAILAMTAARFAVISAEEPVGDSVNRRLKGVFNFPWIPSQFRPQINWQGEPWRTTFTIAVMLLTFANSEVTTINLAIVSDGTWIVALALGAGIAPLMALLLKEKWNSMVSRDPVQA